MINKDKPKRAPGRPKKISDGRDYKVYLDTETAEIAKEIGQGSLSEGIRKAVKTYNNR